MDKRPRWPQWSIRTLRAAVVYVVHPAHVRQPYARSARLVLSDTEISSGPAPVLTLSPSADTPDKAGHSSGGARLRQQNEVRLNAVHDASPERAAESGIPIRSPDADSPASGCSVPIPLTRKTSPDHGSGLQLRVGGTNTESGALNARGYENGLFLRR